jgi:hypothetical protein
MSKRQSMILRRLFVAGLFLCATGSVCLAQKDHGVRPGPPGAGAPLKHLTDIELSMFEEGLQRAVQLEGVCDDCNDLTLGSLTELTQANLVTKTNSSGLGVRFNGDQCTACHNQPALGGSGGFMVPNPQGPPGQHLPPENPMFRLIPQRKGAKNSVPSFITQYGPIREVRFAKKPSGAPDGGVHQLFTVVGRSDVFPPGETNTCTAEALPPTDFETQFKNGNTRFRTPLQLFGLGILDGIQDREILGRHKASEEIREGVGDSRHSQSQRQRWHDHPLRLEGAKQVHHDFCRGSLQRRNGCHQRLIPASHRRKSRLHRRQKRAQRYLPKRFLRRSQSRLQESPT